MTRAVAVEIAPSILAADFRRLGPQVQETLAAGVRRLHVDVMDGHFVPNISMGPLVVAALRPLAERADALIGVPPLGDDRDLAQLLERVGISLAGERAGGGPIESSSRYIGGPDAPLISTPDRAGVVYPDGAGAARFGVLASRSEAPVVHVAAPPPAQVNNYIVEDESRVVSAMTSPSGEQAIVNIVRRNRDAIRA